MTHLDPYLSLVLSDLNLNSDLHDIIISKMDKLQLKKGEEFIIQNKHASYIGIIVHGMLESKFKHSNDKFYTANFYYPEGNRLVSDYRSFSEGHPAQESCVALETSLLWVLSKKKFDQLYEEYDEVKAVSKYLLDTNFLHAIKRIRFFQTYQGKDRIREFKSRHPQIIKKATQDSIASFLGMGRTQYCNKLKEIE